MAAILVFAWWLSAFIPLLLMSDIEVITWAGLLMLILVSFIGGPILGAVLGVVIISQFEFWGKPVFGKRKGR